MKQLHIALGALALAATLSTQTAKADSFTFTWGDANTAHGSGIMTGSEVSAAVPGCRGVPDHRDHRNL